MRARTVAILAVVTTSAWSRAAQAQDVPESGDVIKLLSGVRPVGVALSVLVVLAANLALRFVATSASRLSTQFNSRRLLIQRVESITRFSVYTLAAVVIVGLSFEINADTIKMIAVVFGFGFGFAIKDVIASVIAGMTIMFDQPFQVGDRVNYAGEYGDIIQIGLRSVRMRTLDKAIVTIPNNKILTDVTSSNNYGALHMQVPVDFYVGADQDLERAERLVREAVLTSRYVYLAEPVVVRISQEIVADMVVIRLRAKGFVLDTRYERDFVTDVSRRAITAFREHGVFPPAAFSREYDAGASGD